MELSKLQFKKIMDAINKGKAIPEMVHEHDVPKLMQWSNSTWYHKKKNIPPDWYTVNALGVRFYYKEKLLGLH
jgi:hypothetical protein